MKTIIQFLVITICFAGSINAQTYTLNWGSSFSGGWPNTATSRNALNINGSGVNCSVAVTKSGGAYANVYGTYGGPPTPTVSASTFIVPGSSNNLQLSLDFTNATQYCDIVFTFSQPVFNVSFKIADIDRLGNTYNNYFDRVTVTGYIGALSGGATITKYDAVTDPNFIIVSGNSAYVNSAVGASGNTLTDATDQKGTVNVIFDQFYITSFRIRYDNLAGVLANPTVQNIGIGNVSFMTSVPLPLTLGSFDGMIARDGNVQLRWNTTEESGFDYFSVERSEEGNNFREIGSVNGHGSPHHYLFTDFQSWEGKGFYRLKMVNLDGSYMYSKTIMVNAGAIGFSVYPTITSGRVNVLFRSDGQSKVLLEVKNLSGQTVFRESFMADAGNNNKSIELPSHLPPGQYFVGLENHPKFISIFKR